MSQCKVFCNKTKILLGKSSIEELGAEVKNHGVKTILCVYGSGSAKKNGVYDRVTKSLKDNGIEIKELWGIQPNPLISKVREGVAICKDPANKIDAILAIGGGSVIDSSKAIAAGALLDGDIYDYYMRKIPQPQKMLPLFSVLTLSATGSEFNFGSVVSNPAEHLKIPTYFPESPVASAIDPTVQFSLPWRQIMCGAVDGMSHLMESMFHFDTDGLTTRNINFSLQRSIIQCMEIMTNEQLDYAARENFCWAVSLALNGLPHFGNAGDWNVHYIEHCISSFNDKIAHGEGLAVISNHYYPIMYKKGICTKQFELWAKEVMCEDDVNKALAKYTELLKKWKAPLTLPDIGITEMSDVEKIADYFMEHSAIGIKSPVNTLTRDGVKEILVASLSA